MTTIQLTATQTLVLQHALDHNNGRIDWFPESVKGGARKKVLDGLINRALITPSGNDWMVAAEGYDALGCARPGAGAITPEPQIVATVIELTPCESATTGASQVLADEIDCQDPSNQEIAASNDIDPEIEAAVCAIEDAARAQAKAPRTRENSKQATVISMLKRTEGATIAQICEATSWQAHTVRGTFAGAFKKKLGMTITSDKAQGGVRTYRAAA
ncbi:DUF3489 domain-containing protein [Rhodoferax antarcticus]|uniref:DUF3489 domain-containing protein n=1 Tax=Rhodoferax antarcticus TaxID=81479 RepID=UPI002224B18F|nr:DUF3489 domain-containing protein [Rhodoferax antarcticus]MCW2311457.1 hypothetical protein [Rhodoferax antarcticus]